MSFFTRVLYKLSLFDSTVAFLAPRASAVGYLCARFPRLPLLGRCLARYLCARSPRLPPLGRRRRRACRPRASVVGYLLSPLPSLATSRSPPPSRLSPPRLSCGYLCAPSPRLPSVGRRCRCACRHCASVGGYLLSPFPSFATSWLRYRCVLRPCPPVVGYLLRPLPSLVHACSFILVAQKEKKTGVLQCKI